MLGMESGYEIARNIKIMWHMKTFSGLKRNFKLKLSQWREICLHIKQDNTRLMNVKYGLLYSIQNVIFEMHL